jgi:pyrroloquinoline quinone (PQQ) biosynthesis protein C
MQDNVMQTAMQPFIKLTQANMDLLAKFSMSPEAIPQLMQGMIKNYTEFMTEVGQSGMAVLAQGQAAMMRQAQEASENVIDASDGRGRRTR